MADQPTSPPPPAADAEQRLNLALRLLAMSHRVTGGQLKLTPGKLPDDLSFALPLPDGARILGAQSIAHTDARAPMVTILFEMPLTPEPSVQAFAERLEAQGWTREFMPHMRGGFMHTMPGFDFQRYRQPEGDYVLVISSLPGESAPTTVSIAAHQEPPMRGRPDGFRDLQELLPSLFPPPGAAQQGGGGGGGNTRRYTSANLTTERPIAEVMANYDQQLERGGGRRRSGAVSGPVGWSYWSFADEQGAAWRGSLVVSGDPDHPREYVALLQIEAQTSEDGDGPHSGWTVHGVISG